VTRISAAWLVGLLAITQAECVYSQDDPFRTSPLPVDATRPATQRPPAAAQPPRPRREVTPSPAPVSRVCDAGGATTSDAGGIVGMRNMRVSQGHNCGVRFSDGAQREMRLDLAPRNGRVELRPDGYRYFANPNYIGRDSFSVSRQGPRGRIRSDVVVEVVR
jgi:hypothetical protein